MEPSNRLHWWLTPPSQFDIVSAFFPERGFDVPGLKLRPALVLAVFQEEESGDYACRLAFGTKVLKLMQRRHLDLIIQNATHLQQLGLYRATRFDLDLLVTVPWNAEFLGCWSGYRSPVIGTLTEDYVREYAYLMMRRTSVPRA